MRLGLCNLDCAWCDTPWTWDWTGKNGPAQDKGALIHMTPIAVAAEVKAFGAPLTVITGGEPMLQAKKVGELLMFLGAVEIETNGTIPPPDRWGCRFNVSPKLVSSGVDEKHAVAAMVNYGPVPRAVFKFVVGTPDDLAMVDDLVRSFDVDPARVWIMPEGRTRDALVTDAVGRLAEDAIVRGYNFSNRLHVLLWNDERGR